MKKEDLGGCFGLLLLCRVLHEKREGKNLRALLGVVRFSTDFWVAETFFFFHKSLTFQKGDGKVANH